MVSIFGRSQTVNGYANVTAISGTTLTVASVDETAHTFEDGNQIIIMQMQDNCIGSNTTNVSTFGNLSAIQSAGLFEVFQIISHTEVAGLPATIVVDHIPHNTYNINANSSVQLITYRLYGSPDYVTTSNMSAKTWNGTTGGVLAFQVTGVLTLSHNLTVNGLGFRGGAASTNFYSGGTGCSTTEFIRTSNHTRAGAKGEGIYRTSTTDFLYASGRLLNGGGGGSERINCGGGGGGNYSTGGLGGVGWSCGGPGGGGLGGASFSTNISASRIFMGGGGGGGQQNDSQGSAGGSGGGIILVKAGSIITTGACGGRVISANGTTVTGNANDGQGGGGAAGSIVIQANSFSILGTCALTVSANGGRGGTANTSTHAGGGGGAQGVVIYSLAQPTTNVVTQTNNGAGGCNNNSNPCTDPAGTATGTNNAGIIANGATPLPVEFLSFDVQPTSVGKANLVWRTATEKNSHYFEVQKSFDGLLFDSIGHVKGNGTTSEQHHYSFVDYLITANTEQYYRLRQVDFDGSYNYSPLVFFRCNNIVESDVSIAPNPNEGNFKLKIKNTSPALQGKVFVYSLVGIEVFSADFMVDPETAEIELDVNQNLVAGIYVVKVDLLNQTLTKKLIVSLQ